MIVVADVGGMPVFGLNSGFDVVSGRGGLNGKVMFFTAMNERLGGEKAAQYFLRGFGFQGIDDPLVEEGDDINNDATAIGTNATRHGYYGDGLFILPIEEKSNSAFQQRYDCWCN